ncbi:alpha/beta hydrolase family protein [Nocardiopsis lambiniae]|uniref:Dienelactone hydrolase family protein n=1 Tax=Nocardiopsis lambiniae TaxID=3075539 RepID=A0ABU2M329_9ACTN|nr:dienelactone hydrolase family protein [Nocardiopsis sp. DSM 44743]MDT0327045.1 dienelactone hydrolase family protein [Nocardiopsis sp. DSM 44743]
MTWSEIALLGSIAPLLLALCAPARARRPLVCAALVLVAGCAVAGLVSGPRWQWYPIAVGALVMVALGVLRLWPSATGPEPRGRTRNTVIVLTLLLGLVAATGGGAMAWAIPVPVFPVPSGPHPVGAVTAQWTDPDREETWTDDPADRRTVVARIWYPAAPGADGERALYLGRDAREADIVAEGLAAGLGMPGFVLEDASRARAHAVPDAPPVAGRHPLVLFSPGLGGVRTQNTVWAEGLASHGYVVVAVDHPYDSAVVVLDDGTVVRGALTATGDPEEDDRLADEWTRIRADDLGLVLTRLVEEANADEGPLSGLVDPERVAMAGHSLGGAAALLAAAGDQRVDAVIDLDGLPRLPRGASLSQPVLALVAAAGTGSPEGDVRYAVALDGVFAASTAPGHVLSVPGTAHLSFSDSPFLIPPFPSLVGSLGRAEPARITEAASLAFLDATLKGADVDLDAALAPLGEVTPMP